ncbi:MAG: flagellar basal body-associated FliL family protein [Sphingopyxis sp.]
MTEAPQPPPKKKKMKMILVSILGVSSIGGAGAAAAIYFVGGAKGDAHQEPERPQLVARTDADSTAVSAALRSGRRPDPQLFELSYVPLEEKVTVNLGDSESYAQIGIALSTYYGEPVLENIEHHKLAIQSTILMTVANQDSVSINTPAGRAKLQNDLTQSINATLQRLTGFGGVEEVQFTSFVTQ